MGSRPAAPQRAKGPGAPSGTLWLCAPPRSALLPGRNRSLRLGRDLRLLRELVGVLSPPSSFPRALGEARPHSRRASRRESERATEEGSQRPPEPRAGARPGGACRCCLRRLPNRRVCDTPAARARPAPRPRPPRACARPAPAGPAPPTPTSQAAGPRAQAPPSSCPGLQQAQLSTSARAATRGRPGASPGVAPEGTGVPRRWRLRLARGPPPPGA